MEKSILYYIDTKKSCRNQAMGPPKIIIMSWNPIMKKTESENSMQVWKYQKTREGKTMSVKVILRRMVLVQSGMKVCEISYYYR